MERYSASSSEFNLSLANDPKKFGFVSKKWLVIISLVALVLGLAIGLLIGALAIGGGDDDPDGVVIPGAPQRLMKDADEDVWPMIRDEINAQNIEDNLRMLSTHPHIAGRQNDYNLVEEIKKRWNDYGMEVQTTPYDVLLSYPSDETPNTVRLLDGDDNDKVIYDSTWDQSNITKEKDVVAPFLAFSPKGLIVAPPVYAAYGRVEDYKVLEDKNINVNGSIVIVKYGRLFRGDKIDIAASKGAVGVILYTDPQDYTGQLMGDSRVYPETWWLPGSGVQRGTIFSGGGGDPLTPGFVANDLGYRYEEGKVEPSMPKIPSHPIGYGAAIKILREMTGDEVPAGDIWRGGMNITYKLGPGFVNKNMKLELNVTSKNHRKIIHNVFGIIKGDIEPDRYVMMGNHRDAWIYGAVDPSSGTAVMLEVSRVMTKLVNEGKWKPRRSIMFCSWGAEEYGLIGSTEWVEQYVATLRERGVAYINVDIAVRGNDTLRALGNPVLHSITYDATKKVPNPKPSEIKAGRKTVYDSWKLLVPRKDDQGKPTGEPIIGKPSSGSDYAAVIQKAGIDSIDLSYNYDVAKYKVSTYTVYHTEYETFDLVKQQFDREFKCHQAIGRIASELIRRLSDSLLLPFNLVTYGEYMEEYRQTLHKDYGTQLKQHLSNYGVLKDVIANFSRDIADFEVSKNSLKMNNPFVIRQVNDQIMLLEKCFLSPQGLPTRPFKKHLIFAENANDAYAGSSFPGIVDLMFEIDQHPDRWEEVKKHFSTVVQTIQSAGASLRDVTKFMSETL